MVAHGGSAFPLLGRGSPARVAGSSSVKMVINTGPDLQGSSSIALIPVPGDSTQDFDGFLSCTLY